MLRMVGLLRPFNLERLPLAYATCEGRRRGSQVESTVQANLSIIKGQALGVWYVIQQRTGRSTISRLCLGTPCGL